MYLIIHLDTDISIAEVRRIFFNAGLALHDDRNGQYSLTALSSSRLPSGERYRNSSMTDIRESIAREKLRRAEMAREIVCREHAAGEWRRLFL